MYDNEGCFQWRTDYVLDFRRQLASNPRPLDQ